MQSPTNTVLDWLNDPARTEARDHMHEIVDAVLRDSARLGYTRQTEVDEVAEEMVAVLDEDTQAHGGRELTDLDRVDWCHIASTLLAERRDLPENAIDRTAYEWRIEVPTVLHFSVRATSEPEALAAARAMLQQDPDNIANAHEGFRPDLTDGYVGMDGWELRKGLPDMRVVDCTKVEDTPTGDDA